METKGLTVLAIMVMCILMVQVSAQPTPFMIYGYVSYEDGTACNDPTVNINNTNTGNNWSTEIKTNAGYNYYQLMLANGTDVNASEVLRFNVTSPDGSPSNVTEHAVTQENISDGGIFNFNITLEAPAPTPTLVVYTISNRTIIPPQTTEIDVEFSERVEAWMKIEDVNRNLVNELYHSTSVIDPNPRTWDGTYTNDSVVPAGVYYVNVTGTNTTTGLSVVNNTETITVVTEAVGAPTADSLGVEDTSGRSGTYVVVPVNITNVMNGPVQGIRLEVDYNESVLNLTNIGNGDLTSAWTTLQLGEDRHTIVIATGHLGDAIPDGSSGSVIRLNFSVTGSSGDMSPMNFSLIELSNPEGIVGTAPAKNGTFVVSKLGIIVGRITYACNGTGIAGAVVNLTIAGAIVNTTVANESGYYIFTDVIPGSYFVNASKSRFWDNSTEVTVIAGETTTADMTLWLKGDLNNNCEIADAGDVVLMLRASVGDISGDMHYDLNENDIIADPGDVVLMLRASVRDIELL